MRRPAERGADAPGGERPSRDGFRRRAALAVACALLVALAVLVALRPPGGAADDEPRFATVSSPTPAAPHGAAALGGPVTRPAPTDSGPARAVESRGADSDDDGSRGWVALAVVDERGNPVDAFRVTGRRSGKKFLGSEILSARRSVGGETLLRIPFAPADLVLVSPAHAAAELPGVDASSGTRRRPVPLPVVLRRGGAVRGTVALPSGFLGPLRVGVYSAPTEHVLDVWESENLMDFRGGDLRYRVRQRICEARRSGPEEASFRVEGLPAGGYFVAPLDGADGPRLPPQRVVVADGEEAGPLRFEVPAGPTVVVEVRFEGAPFPAMVRLEPIAAPPADAAKAAAEAPVPIRSVALQGGAGFSSVAPGSYAVALRRVPAMQFPGLGDDLWGASESAAFGLVADALSAARSDVLVVAGTDPLSVKIDLDAAVARLAAVGTSGDDREARVSRRKLLARWSSFADKLERFAPAAGTAARAAFDAAPLVRAARASDLPLLLRIAAGRTPPW